MVRKSEAQVESSMMKPEPTSENHCVSGRPLDRALIWPKAAASCVERDNGAGVLQGPVVNGPVQGGGSGEMTKVTVDGK